MQYFGLDDTQGYSLLYTIQLQQLVEKHYALAQAQQIFDDLTEGQSKNISSFNDIYGPHLPCDFIKIDYPSGSIQVHFIGYAPNPATFALDLESEAQHTGVRVLNNITKFFYGLENAAWAVRHFYNTPKEALRIFSLNCRIEIFPPTENRSTDHTTVYTGEKGRQHER